MKNTDNLRLVTTDAPSRLLEKHSPARMHLADLINRKLRIESNLRHLGESAQRLQEAQTAQHDAVAAINALNAVESAAMAEWSRDGSGPMPELDVAKRDELQARHRGAVAKATAARQAAAAIAADQQRETAVLKQITDEIDLAIVPIIIEEVEPKIAAFKTAFAELAAKRAEITAASETINLIAFRLSQMASGQPNPEAGRPAFVALEALNEAIRLAFAAPPPDATNHRAPWEGFSNALKRDPIAQFED
jgi:DNA repair exonuclease SbcCD ATPase subunit